MRRRALLVFAAMMVAVLWVLAGCGGEGDRGGEQEEGAAITGEFVGETRDADAFVAVVAEEPREGGGGAREVRAYLCDGESINVWLTGTAVGDDLKLSSEGGARLEGALAPQTATGRITLPDGRSLAFEAPLAEGVDGFYPVSVPAEGPLSATSWRGAHLEGERTGERIAGTFAPPEGEGGEPVDFEVSVPDVVEGDNRWIVLTGVDRLRIKGAKKGATTTGFVDPISDL